MKLPPPLSWLWALWNKFSHVFGLIMSKIILTILWIVGFGTYGIILKIVGLFRSKKTPESYWVDTPEELPDHLKYQF